METSHSESSSSIGNRNAQYGEQSLPLQIPSSLEQWKKNWDTAYKYQLRVPYLFSRQYDCLWDGIWTTYDELEALRLASSALALPWQTRMEKYRSQRLRLRNEFFDPVKPSCEGHFPLWVQYDGVCNGDNIDRTLHWKATLDNWGRFEKLHSDAARVGTHSLSPRQTASYELLKDWWAGDYSTSETLDHMKAFLHQSSETIHPDPAKELPKVFSAIQGEKPYCFSLCFRLFLHEFNPRMWEPFTSWTSLSSLEKVRTFASWNATAHLLSCRIMRSQSLCSEAHYPSIAPFSDTVSSQRLTEDHPRWLWDVENYRSILVDEMERCPPYTCISHTWGRWRKPTSVKVAGVSGWEVPENHLYDVRELPKQLSQLNCHYVWLDLFCIPQNMSRAAQDEIARQTSIFHGAERCIAWIHDVERWDDVLRGLEFLAIEYLATYDKAKSTPDPKIHVSQRDTDLAPQGTGLMSHPAASRIEHTITSSPPSNSTKADTRPDVRLEPSTWFSSLWTLQEALLCPGIHLFTKDWKRLNDATGEAITLLSLVIFLHLAFPSGLKEGDDRLFKFSSQPMNPGGTPGEPFQDSAFTAETSPSSVRRLSEFLDMTRLDNVLFNSCIVSILFNANVRRCTGNRAPAIMSAIGVTEWYVGRLADDSNPLLDVENLVLGVYPLDFVREACAKSGARFFEATFTISKRRFERSLETKKAIGSMLPFCRPKGWLWGRYGPPEVSRIGIHEHPAARDWVILSDGMVSMPTAGIFSTSTETDYPKKSGSILWSVGSDADDGRTDDFHMQLRQLANGSVVHAVCLYQDKQIQHGIVLEEANKVFKDDCPQYLVRVGMYWVWCSSVRPEMPKLTEVDWIIL
jgi:hypothetical protein